MTDISQAEARETLFDTLIDVRAGMLGISGSSSHMQPMTQFLDRDTATLWFITSRKTDLVAEVGAGADAHFNITGEDHKAWACMSGRIEQSDNSAKLDELWSVVTAAWFDKGRDDPDICLLKMPLRDAMLWTSVGNPLVFGLEIARSNMSETKKPDVGAQVHIDFQVAA